MKKTFLLAGIIMSVLIVSGCTTNGGNEDVIVISDGNVIDPQVCTKKGIADMVVIFHSPTCPACLNTIPVLEDLEDEVTTDFMFIDVSTDDDKMETVGIAPTHIPTTVIDCKAYTGYRDKETFRRLIEGE